MRYNLDYSFIWNHLFECVILGFIGLIVFDVYNRYYRVTWSTEDQDSQIVEKYIKLQRMRKNK